MGEVLVKGVKGGRCVSEVCGVRGGRCEGCGRCEWWKV